MDGGADHQARLREEALTSLKKKQGFRVHLVTYLAVNALLIVIWAFTGGPFWPAFVIGGWGIGLAANAWDVYGRSPITEADIEAEAARLSERGAPAPDPSQPGRGKPVP